MLTPGEILKKRRNALGKTVFEVSQETKILEKYVKKLESNDFSDFDSPVFAKGFIRIYSNYLGLDDEKVLALFRRENKSLNEIAVKAKSRKLGINNLNLPKTILYISTALILLFFSLYSINQVRLFREMPTLQIISPSNGLQTASTDITIEGIATVSSDIFVNEIGIENIDGIFKYPIKLQPGENTFTIKAVNKRNKGKVSETVVKVYYQPTVEISKDEIKNEIVTQTLTLKIKNENTWIKLIVDKKQKLAQTVSTGYNKSHTFTDSFEVVTGKIANTQVYINSKLWSLNIDANTGIASLTCKVENKEVICPQ